MKTAELKYQTPLQDRYPFRETHRFDETATVTLRNPLPPPKRTVFLKISLETAELHDLPPERTQTPSLVLHCGRPTPVGTIQGYFALGKP